jgi:hypothetical protein
MVICAPESTKAFTVWRLISRLTYSMSTWMNTWRVQRQECRVPETGMHTMQKVDIYDELSQQAGAKARL